VADETMSTDEGLKPEEKKNSCPSAKADGNTCRELLFPLRQLKLPIPSTKADGNAER
jgi:hypothetical protein